MPRELRTKVHYKYQEYDISINELGKVAVFNGTAILPIARGVWRCNYVSYPNEMAYDPRLLDKIDGVLKDIVRNDLPKLWGEDTSKKKKERKMPDPSLGFLFERNESD